MSLSLATFWVWLLVALGSHAEAATSRGHADSPNGGNASCSLDAPEVPAGPPRLDDVARTDAEIETFEDENKPLLDHSCSPFLAQFEPTSALRRSTPLAASPRTLNLTRPSGIIDHPIRC